jgi:hypothetical protein
MKRSRKLLAIVSLVLLLTLAFTGLASADVIRGKGWLYAKGSGVANIHTSGYIDITGHGVGLVYIRGAENIEASGQGRRVNRADGSAVFYGYEGEIHASGRNMVVRMVGKQIEFKAVGAGKAGLRGRGYYETRGGSGDWAPDGLDIEVMEE